MTDPALERLSRALRAAVRSAGGDESFEPELSRPRDRGHGDWATNAALVLAGPLGQPPHDIARRIAGELDLEAAGVAGVEVAGPGFLNFRLADEGMWERLVELIQAGEAWGRSEGGSGRRVNVEFVSANPTGPLHVAHGRGAALGDAVASLLDWTGHDVTREFYINDAGNQIRLLAESVEARYQQARGREAEVPEGGYQGDYIATLAEQLAARLGVEGLDALSVDDRLARFEAAAVESMRRGQADDLERFGVHMDVWFSETSLYESGAIERLLTRLDDADLTYRSEGALWLNTSAFGDEKDRVLIKGDGSYTYFLPDLAYHLDKADRGFDLTIDVWGADHQGHEKRMLAALAGLGLPDLLEVLILQLVTVMRGGEEARMSKRAGRFVTLGDLVDETGPDVTRYFFLMRRAEVHLNFDLDLALDTSEANPVYKIQYAHARMCSVFEKGGIEPEAVEASLDGLDELETEAERAVAAAVLRLPEAIGAAARARAPHILCTYLEEVSGLVNSWYHQGNLDPALRMLADGPAREGRIKLARAVQVTLRNGLIALGVSAPRSMSRETT
ncbi:MAG: arginine--tRNA ligase [Gemmatimonadota bacterium]|nr:arginine--tRNA ligase [Gemmatimonadota bacterium]